MLRFLFGCARKYKIEENSGFVVEEQGLLLKPIKSFWDMVGSGSDAASADKIGKLLYNLRHEKDH